MPVVRDYHAGLNPRRQRNFRLCCQFYEAYLTCERRYKLWRTEQYDPCQEQVCVIAIDFINPGEELEGLQGICASVPRGDVNLLEQQGLDFSLVDRSVPHLLLGLPRFVNSECKPNCELKSDYDQRVSVVASEHICPGEEITINYGDSYFAPGECRCWSCCSLIDHEIVIADSQESRSLDETCVSDSVMLKSV